MMEIFYILTVMMIADCVSQNWKDSRKVHHMPNVCLKVKVHFTTCELYLSKLDFSRKTVKILAYNIFASRNFSSINSHHSPI